MTAVCGANSLEMEEVGGKSIEEVQAILSSILNVTPDHDKVLVDGKPVNTTEYRLTGKEEEIEFVKRSGQKG